MLDYGNPYWIRQAADGYCVTPLRPQTHAYAIWVQRPHTCHKYDCRNDRGVWLDFDKISPAPMPDISSHASVAMAEVGLKGSRRAKEE